MTFRLKEDEAKNGLDYIMVITFFGYEYAFGGLTLESSRGYVRVIKGVSGLKSDT
jgi:hypothetical protein